MSGGVCGLYQLVPAEQAHPHPVITVLQGISAQRGFGSGHFMDEIR